MKKIDIKETNKYNRMIEELDNAQTCDKELLKEFACGIRRGTITICTKEIKG